MDRKTVLRALPCDPKRLALGPVDAFVLSQLDGHVELGDVAEIVGIPVSEAIAIAHRLVAAGAASAGKPSKASLRPARTVPPRRTSRASQRAVRAARPDPRAEIESIRPPRSVSPRSVPPRSAPPTRRSRKSLQPQRPAGSTEPPSTARSSKPTPSATASRSDELCELDEATQSTILTLVGGDRDHYALLGVERSASRKEIKRAYFALASKFHPDRFFKKKLGPLRAPLEKLFKRLTDAHDVLTDEAARATYDGSLPPASRAAPPRIPTPPPRIPTPPPRIPTPPPRIPTPPPRRSTAPKRGSRASIPKVEAVTIVEKAPPTQKSPAIAPPPPTQSVPSPAVRPAPPPKLPRRLAPEAQRRVDGFVQAGDEALRKQDVIGAANYYRLALHNTNDPQVRAKLEMVEDMAKHRRFELSLPRARTAEREHRWGDAAYEYARAHSARPTPETAERTAHALRMCEGDLAKATELAERAVARSPKNAAFRVTLGEIHLHARRLDRAATECEHAIALGPADERVRSFAESLARARRAR